MSTLQGISKQIDELIEMVDNADKVAIIVNEESSALDESPSRDLGWTNTVMTCFYLEILFCVNVLFCAMIYRVSAAVV
jgi:hypothetical protein